MIKELVKWIGVLLLFFFISLYVKEAPLIVSSLDTIPEKEIRELIVHMSSNRTLLENFYEEIGYLPIRRIQKIILIYIYPPLAVIIIVVITRYFPSTVWTGMIIGYIMLSSYQLYGEVFSEDPVRNLENVIRYITLSPDKEYILIIVEKYKQIVSIYRN